MTTHPRASRRFFRRSIAASAVAFVAVLGVSTPASAAGPTLGPNLLQNGGFEEPALTAPSLTPFNSTIPLPGWAYVSTSNGSVQVSTTYDAPALPNIPAVHLDPAEGNQFIGLIGDPDVGYTAPGSHSYRLFQQFPTEVGKTYQVSYWIAGGPNVETLCVRLICTGAVTAGDDGGGNSISAPSHYPTSSTWVQYSYAYTATTTLGNLYVYGSAAALGVAPLFDGVSVQEVIPAVVDTPIASAPVVLLSITVAGVALAGVLAVLGWRRRVASPAPRSNATP